MAIWSWRWTRLSTAKSWKGTASFSRTMRTTLPASFSSWTTSHRSPRGTADRPRRESWKSTHGITLRTNTRTISIVWSQGETGSGPRTWHVRSHATCRRSSWCSDESFVNRPTFRCGFHSDRTNRRPEVVFRKRRRLGVDSVSGRG